MSGILFNRGRLTDLTRAYPRKMQDEVDGWDRNKVLAASESDLIDYLVRKYILDAPRLRPREEWDSAADEVTVDVSHDFRRAAFADGGRVLVPGHRVSVRVPFEGDPDLFEYRPSTYDLNPPRAELCKRESTLVLTFNVPQDDADAEKINQDLNNEIARIDRYLGQIRDDCATWNSGLRETATKCLERRKRRLLEQAKLLGQLGIPLKRREVADNVFSIPVARRSRPRLRVPETPLEVFEPEPTIASDDYEFILDLISKLAISIEQSPTTFSRLPEEHIRDHILVVLNTHFEGGATGETFNGLGKTDILIREKGANAFIGECKFWSGRTGLHKAIDQLLGYTIWRDTKTALILFSRNRDFTSVLAKIADYVPRHRNCKRLAKRVSETHLRYVFGQKNDPSREVHLAILVFNIPSPDTT